MEKCAGVSSRLRTRSVGVAAPTRYRRRPVHLQAPGRLAKTFWWLQAEQDLPPNTDLPARGVSAERRSGYTPPTPESRHNVGTWKGGSCLPARRGPDLLADTVTARLGVAFASRRHGQACPLSWPECSSAWPPLPGWPGQAHKHPAPPPNHRNGNFLICEYPGNRGALRGGYRTAQGGRCQFAAIPPSHRH